MNNQNDDVTILVVSCDAYKDLWKPFFHCFFKYWNDCEYPVYLASNYEKYDDSRVNIINYGEDDAYSTNLLNILKEVDSKWIMLWFEDALIYSKVDNSLIKKLISDAKENNAGYLKFTVDLPIFYSKNGENIGELPRGVKYRSGIGLALYQKDTLLKLLEPGLSAWELDKSTISDSLIEPFMALSQNFIWNPPIKVLNGVIKRKWTYGTPKFLKNEGLGELVSNRPVQKFQETIYTRLYLLRSKLYMILRIYWKS